MKAETKTCKPLRVIAKLTASSLLALGLLAPAAQAAMYRWVDARGQVHYGDTLPDTYQKSGAAELGKQGQVVKRTLSEDERRATAAREAEELGKRRAATDQARQDRALLSSFSSVEEIDLAEERALDIHRQAIENAEARARELGQSIAQLNVRKKSLEGKRQPVPAALIGQLKQNLLELEDLKGGIRQREAVMQDVREKYAQDKARYRELSAEAKH